MITIGIDPHKRTLTAAALDPHSRLLGQLRVSASVQTGQHLLVDDIVPLIKNAPGVDAKDAPLRLTRRQLRQWPPHGEGHHRRGGLWRHRGSGGATRS